MARISIGQVYLNQFRVEQFIAAGGMGAVYRVWDLQRSVPLAMKVSHADLADDPSYLRRLQREAEALQQLAHPNIVPFYDIFQADDVAFLLTAFVCSALPARSAWPAARGPCPCGRARR